MKRATSGASRSARAVLPGVQTAKDDHLVVIGVVEERRMGDVLRVEDVVLEELHASEALRPRRERVDLLVGEIEPDEPSAGSGRPGRAACTRGRCR